MSDEAEKRVTADLAELAQKRINRVLSDLLALAPSPESAVEILIISAGAAVSRAAGATIAGEQRDLSQANFRRVSRAMVEAILQSIDESFPEGYQESFAEHSGKAPAS